MPALDDDHDRGDAYGDAAGALVATQVFDAETAEASYILGRVVRFDADTDHWVIADADTEVPAEAPAEAPAWRRSRGG